jgi:hypothetical protein
MPDYAGMPIRKISAMLLSEMFQTPCGNGNDRLEGECLPIRFFCGF